MRSYFWCYLFKKTTFSWKSIQKIIQLNSLHCQGYPSSVSWDFGHLSGYCESVLHSPKQQCLVLTFSHSSRRLALRIYQVFWFFPSLPLSSRIHLPQADQNVCLSRCSPFKNCPQPFNCSKIFFSRSAIHFEPFKIFLQLFSHSNGLVIHLSSVHQRPCVCHSNGQPLVYVFMRGHI